METRVDFDTSMAHAATGADLHRHFAGSTLLTVRGRTLVDRAYGTADRVTGRPNTCDTVFQLASVSKQFTAAAVLLLEEDGVLSVNDPVRRWIHGYSDGWRAITIHQLLSHTAGLPHWPDLPELDLYRPAPWDHLLAIVAGHPLRFPPGHGWAYSSPGYLLLGNIVEQASGQTYRDFLRRRIFQPLDMRATAAGSHPPVAFPRAQGYTAGTPVEPFDLDAAGKGAGDIWSTTGDLARWNGALSTPGRVLGKRSLEKMFEIHASVPSGVASSFPALHPMAYGYGWYLAELGGRRVEFHAGDNPGYRSVLIRIPETDSMVCVLSNDDSGDPGQVAEQLLGLIP